MGAGNPVGNLANTRFGQIAHLLVQTAHRTGQEGFFRNDVVLCPRMELRDGHDDGAQRVGIACCNHLQAVDDL